MTDTSSFSEYLACYFNVSLGAVLKGKFSSVSGLSYEMEIETYCEGGRNDGPLFFPKNTVPQKLILEGGIISTAQISLWMHAASFGSFTRLPGLVTLCNEKGIPAHGWLICNAFPVRYEGPTLEAMESRRALSRVELMHTGILQTF